jgi:hypothetical protein
MDPLTLLALGQGLYGGVQNYKAAQEDRKKAQDARAQANRDKISGEATYKELTEGQKFRVAQAPTKAADLTLSLAEQGLDFARDQGQAGQAQLLAGLRDDPRNVGGLLRGLNQIGQNVQGAEQRAGQQAVTAQKILDDSIYAQQEGERQRLAGLKQQFELLPAMQSYTQQTGLAESLDERAANREAQTLQDAMGITTTLAGMAKQGQSSSTPSGGSDAAAALAQKRQAANDYYEPPIDIGDDDGGGISSLYSDSDVFTPTPVGMGQEAAVDENLDLRTSNQLLNNLNTYEPDTAPFGTPFTNAVNPNALATDPVESLLSGVPQATEADTYRPAPTSVQRLDPITYQSVTDPLNLAGRSTAYQGSGPQSVYNPLYPMDQQVFGAMQGYNPLSYDEGGTYIGDRGGTTSGDFDHDANKKAIVDQESGKKEGELTGGEAVFNDQHLADIVGMIKDGDEDGLLSYLRNLLEEPQFGYEFA